MAGLFLFGTLLDDELRALVAGGEMPARAAVLPEHAVHRAAGADFPALVDRTGAAVPGLLLEPDALQMARLHLYEEGFGFVPGEARVVVDGVPVGAVVYRPTHGVTASDEVWDLGRWQATWGPITRRAARESMSYFGAIDGQTLRGRVPTIFVRADAALRAEADPMPHTLRSGTHRDTILVEKRSVPFADFFAVDESVLRHPTHRGGLSDRVRRVGFLMSDAVTVLPYDPVRDTVLVVEQFRFGIYARGDLYPWSLEPIAGRIDPTETPEQTARREAAEEAHLTMGDLHFVASYYPSPGAVTEYLYTYVGIADLPQSAETLGGAAEEGEDIRAHVISFDRLMELVATGEVDNGPLLATTLWLQHERACGRFA